MFKASHVPFNTSGALSELVGRYIEKDKSLTPFYEYFPDMEGFRKFIDKNPFGEIDRNQLFTIASGQASLVENSSGATITNVAKLKDNTTYTITTGHQLCLFTGPLYFIYKIFSAICLAEELKKNFPDYDFIPVYWMASEDHDFEEVNHFHLFGKTIQWLSQQGGAVGDFKTKELESLMPQVREILGTGEHAAYLVSLFEKAYLGHSNLADATRYLVNELFGAYGLVTIDGNDKLFKEQFRSHFEKDIFDNLAYDTVTETIGKLKELGYDPQVNPRQINCFYLGEGSRMRLERSGDRYALVGSDRSFSEAELREVLNSQPEKISPNVVLRPLYQQAILPNIAYVGGPGELAYWLEYKAMFAAFGLNFPLLVPRNFITVIDKGTGNKIGKLNFTPGDFYKSEPELIQEFQLKSNAVFDLVNEKEKLEALYREITDRMGAVDKTLTGSVSAELQKTLNGLDMLAGKANKALKQRSETEINQIKGIRGKLFPNGVPQERHDNFSSLYLKYGNNFLTTVYTTVKALDFRQRLLVEE